MILSYLGSSRITIRSSDLFGNLRIFLLWLRSLLGSLRIYFGSSLDLSDSSSILEIGLSSEILRISRPFAHPVPFPFYPGSLRPFLYSPPSSLPLLTRLPRYQVTVHLSEIADPDIAEVTRLASLLPTSSTPSFLSTPPVETYT